MKHLIPLLIGFLLLSSAARADDPRMKLDGSVPEAVAQFEMVEIPLQVQATFTDPFDPDDIRLDAVIESPGGKMEVPGYFESGDAQQSKWKLRFTPRQAGSHEISLRLQNGEGTTSIQNIRLDVNPSDRDGFLHLPENGSHYYFEFDSGRKFRGVGENFGWEDRGDRHGTFNYEAYLPKLSAKGANMIRTWMCPWNLPLIWKDADGERYNDDTEYRYNRAAIEHTDQMFELARENDIYVILVLDYHGALKTEEDYWGGNNYWPDHPYNVENGGDAEKPADYFTADRARELYKERLRYVIARWGAYTSLGTIEFWNEVDNAMEDERIPPEVITEWHNEMGRYLDKIDPYNHLVTTSVSHRHIPGMFGAEGVDYSQIHLYGRTAQMSTLLDSVRTLYPKPAIVGEIGYDWRSPADSSEADFVRDLHQSFWAGMFEPTPVLPLPWWWEFFYERTGNKQIRVAADFNRQMVGADWRELSESHQPKRAGLKSLVLGNGEVYFALVQKKTGWDNGPVELKLVQSGHYSVQGYDTRRGVFFDYPPVDADRDGFIQLPGALLVNRDEAALIIKRED